MRFLFLIFVIGCATTFRPIELGVKWQEREEFSGMCGNLAYVKNCVYTDVKENGEYLFNCIYNPEAVNDLGTGNAV